MGAAIDDALNGFLYYQTELSGATLAGFASIIADYLDANNRATLSRLGLSAIAAVNAQVLTAPLNRPIGWVVGGNIELISGTGAGQKRKIIAYNAVTHVATVNAAWDTQPVDGTGWQIEPKTNIVHAGDEIIFLTESGGVTTAKGMYGSVVIEFDERID